MIYCDLLVSFDSDLQAVALRIAGTNEALPLLMYARYENGDVALIEAEVGETLQTS